MKRKAFLLAIMIALVVCALTIVISAESVYEYYLVQAEDSEAALALKADGKDNVVVFSSLFEKMGNSDSDVRNTTTRNTFLSQFDDRATVKFTLAENLITDTGDYTCMLLYHKAQALHLHC